MASLTDVLELIQRGRERARTLWDEVNAGPTVPTPDALYYALSGPPPAEPKRLGLLPRYSAQDGLVAPAWLNDLATAAGDALTGEGVSPEKAFSFAGNLLGTGLGAGAFAPVEGTVAGMAARGGKGKRAIGNLFEAVNDPAEAARMARRGEHLKRDKNGYYVGAPDWVDSPADLGRLRRNADAQVAGGDFNMSWYDRARDAATLLSDDPAKQSLFARGTAAYSPQAMPSVEVGAFAKQHNAKVLTGEDVVPRTGSQSRNVARAYDTYGTDGQFQPESIRLGKKTGPYADAKDPTVDEASLYRTANDIWHGRVMGYGDDFSRGFTPQEHGFLTGENLLLADRAAARDAAAGVTRESAWTPRSAQAATWGTARKAKRIEELLTRHNKEQAAKRPENRVPPDMAAIEAEAEAYARGGIDDAVARNSAYLTNEARTGVDVGHLPMSDAERPLIDSYTTLVRDSVGRDPVVEGLGMYNAEPVPTQGYFVNANGVMEKNPGWADQVLVGSDMSGLPKTPAAETAALDYAAAVGGFNRAQAAGAWSRFFPEGMGKMKVSDMNAVALDTNPLTPAQFGALEARLADINAQPIDYGRGRFLATTFADAPVGPAPGQADWVGRIPRTPTRVGTLLDAVQAAGLEGEATRGLFEGGYQPSLLDVAPGQADWVGGRATQRLLDAQTTAAGQIENLAARTDPRIAAEARVMNEIDAAIQAATGKPVRDDLMRARQIMADGFEGRQGVSALRAWVEKHGPYGLPAIVLGILGLPDRQRTDSPLATARQGGA